MAHERATARVEGRLRPLMSSFGAAVATRFVLSGRDLERNVRQAAAKIATDLAARVEK
jgi:hypothetical protein